MLKKLVMLFSLVVLVGCSSTGNVKLSEKQYEKREVCNVKIYGDFTDVEREFTKLSIVSHKTYLSGAAVFENEQKRMDKELEKLKQEACELGADGIVITEVLPATGDSMGRTYAKASGTAIRFK